MRERKEINRSMVGCCRLLMRFCLVLCSVATFKMLGTSRGALPQMFRQLFTSSCCCCDTRVRTRCVERSRVRLPQHKAPSPSQATTTLPCVIHMMSRYTRVIYDVTVYLVSRRHVSRTTEPSACLFKCSLPCYEGI